MSFLNKKCGSQPPFLIHQVIPKDGNDRFGLPIFWSLLGEADEERKARISAVERLIKDAFETAVSHLGHNEALRYFAEISKKPPKCPSGK
ncbi:hypothetical protein QEV83_01470 [Methylocapsa sp. D3K7]|uniref:hypothetical protein n=1 Tax=Methylocapsa sp. D3K7 TaxID=3041435 RepID=UPI00244EDB8A|nr:hypothetical protein [Methylocapsa sp. D3K7]WGJ15007.1 hypothetical protein QEV83_01470 [Methylocapsa sp. D3K7]